MEAEGLEDDAVEMVEILYLQVLEFFRADEGIEGGELFAELGKVRRVACEFIYDMCQCGSSGITVRRPIFLVNAVDPTQRGKR